MNYLDPPFNSKTNHNMLFGSAIGEEYRAQNRAFVDTWCWDDLAEGRYREIKNAMEHPAHDLITGLFAIIGNTVMMAYPVYMTDRLLEMRRLLKPAGRIWLHCDPTASHYLKIAMDNIFGHGNFRNEIVWKRRQDTPNPATKTMGSIHDIILWYGNPDQASYNRKYMNYDQKYIQTHCKHNDDDGRGIYRLLPCTNESGGNKPYEFQEITRAWRFSRGNMQELFDGNNLVQLKNNGPFYYKKFLAVAEGVPRQDIWDDIKPARGKEHIGYQTQKPVELLNLIIEATSNRDDLVLDPFCGCGTTIDAAMRTKRNWIGIDISMFAINVVRNRRLKDIEFDIDGIPCDLASARQLASDNPFQFEAWAINPVPGLAPNQKKVGDSGIDGRGNLLQEVQDCGNGRLVLAQVKSGRFSLSQLRDFCHVIEREKAVAGMYITIDPVDTKPARQEELSLQPRKFKEGANVYPRLQFYGIKDCFDRKSPILPPMSDPYTGKKMQGDWIAQTSLGL